MNKYYYKKYNLKFNLFYNKFFLNLIELNNSN